MTTEQIIKLFFAIIAVGAIMYVCLSIGTKIIKKAEQMHQEEGEEFQQKVNRFITEQENKKYLSRYSGKNKRYQKKSLK